MRSAGPLLKPSEQNGKQPMAALARHRKVSRYEILKDKIRTWWNDRLKIGEALREIRDEKLYKADHSTFEEFCVAEFDLKHSQAYRLIEAATVKDSVIKVSPIGERITNEGQARALSAVPEEKRVEVLTEAAKAPGPVTAKRITEAAKSNGHVAKAEAKQEHKDKTGYAIPESILEDWNRAEAFSETLKQLSKIKVEVETGIEDQDVIFREITNTTIATLKNAYGDLKRVLPYAVCPTCQGRTPKKCTVCKGRGFISQFTYTTCIPEQTRTIREAAKK